MREVEQTPQQHGVQVKTLGRLMDELYLTGAIDIGDVRKEYARLPVNDQQVALDEFGPVLRAVLQAGIGDYGYFEGVKR